MHTTLHALVLSLAMDMEAKGIKDHVGGMSRRSCRQCTWRASATWWRRPPATWSGSPGKEARRLACRPGIRPPGAPAALPPQCFAAIPFTAIRFWVVRQTCSARRRTGAGYTMEWSTRSRPSWRASGSSVRRPLTGTQLYPRMTTRSMRLALPWSSSHLSPCAQAQSKG